MTIHFFDELPGSPAIILKVAAHMASDGLVNLPLFYKAVGWEIQLVITVGSS